MVKEHTSIIEEVAEQLKTILDNSEQGIYVYLDDENKVCNKKFAAMLGYASPDEWASNKEPFPMVFVAEKSRQLLVTTYQTAMEKYTSAKVNITWIKKQGETIDSEVILVPLNHNGHDLALHFISTK